MLNVYDNECDPDDPRQIDDWMIRQLNACIPFNVVDRCPINPREDIDREGRGELYRFGENLTADAFVTLEDNDGQRWLLLVERDDGRGFALPGGFMEPNESTISTALRELNEETCLDLYDLVQHSVYNVYSSRYVPDSRNTSRAWIVTHPIGFHLGRVSEFPVVTGSDDATRAMWVRANTFHQLEMELSVEYNNVVFFAHQRMISDLLK